MEFTERQKWALNEFDKLSRSLAKPGYETSDVQAGRLCGVSSSTISSIRSGKYKGDAVYQLEKLAVYLETKAEAEKAKNAYRPVEYAPTGTSTLVYQTIRNIQVMGGFGVVTGDPGVGKTKAVIKFETDNPASCVKITAGACIRSTRAVLKEMALSLGITLSQASNDMYHSIINKLHDGMVIVVDEAQHLTYDSMEAVREISDYFDERGQTCGVVLVGNDGILEKLNGTKTAGKFRQTNGRSWQNPEIRTSHISMSDIKMVFPTFEDEEVLKLLLGIAQADLGMRAAVKLVISASQSGSDCDYDGLLKAAKLSNLKLPNLRRAVQRR